jgi:hypothetical protein
VAPTSLRRVSRSWQQGEDPTRKLPEVRGVDVAIAIKIESGEVAQFGDTTALSICRTATGVYFHSP